MRATVGGGVEAIFYEFSMKNTNVLLDLVKPYNVTYRFIKTNRYYISVELAVNIEKENLYNNGTIKSNRIPKDLR